MKDNLSPYAYTITSEPVIDNTVTPEVSAQLERGHTIALKGKQEGLKQLRKLTGRYPDFPQFKNYLTVWYQVRGNIKKAREINRQILQKHPDYFFAKATLAHEYLEEGNPEKVAALLGHEIDLKQIYPDRDVFHISEVVAIANIAFLYYMKIKDFKRAGDHLNRLREIDPDSGNIERFQSMLTVAEIKESFLFKHNPKYVVETKPQPRTSKTDAPGFYHSEMLRLYKSDVFTREETGHILALPKRTLVRDLEAVLKDSVARFSFFSENITNGGDGNFVLYSFILLRELHAEESLPTVLETLAQSEEYIDLYFGSYLDEYIWEVIFELGKNRLDVLAGFMKRPYVDTRSKSGVSAAVAQFAIHYPQRRKEVVDWYEGLFRYYARADKEKGIIDAALIGIMVCDVLDFCGKELREEIKILFEKGYVDETVCGDWKSVGRDLENTLEENKRDVFTEASGLFSMLGTGDDDYPYNDYTEDEEVCRTPLPESPLKQEKAPGRNDPCFCGSGKKYKKCCLGK